MYFKIMPPEKAFLKILFISVFILFNFCIRQNIKNDINTKFWPVDFIEKYINNESEVVLYKIQEYKFTQNDSLRVNQWEIIKAHSLFLPDSIDLDIFRVKNPFSPVTNFKFQVEKSDSVNFTFIGTKGKNIKITLYHGYLNEGYYLLQIPRINVDSGVYQVICKIGKKTEKKKVLLIR